MTKDDIVTIFSNPITLKFPEGQARLVNKVQELTTLEIWEVEFLDQEGKLYRRLIRKINIKKN
jgi:hypothetical protein